MGSPVPAAPPAGSMPATRAADAKQDVERLNDSLALEHPINDYYEKSPRFIRWVEQRRLQIIREMVAEDPNHRILEVGSGGGHVLRMFKRSKLTALDVSDVFLETAKRNLAGYDVKFMKGELDKLDLAPDQFDRVICTEVLEHTKDPEAILRAIVRVLAPGGRAVITVPNDPLINGLKSVVRRTPVGWVFRGRINWGGDQYHIHVWKPAEFRAVLERHFEIERQVSAPAEWLPLRPCFLCKKPRQP
jgi:2-polyprenyl-3-methyl-5-hydroxy-6-metoxy-1,4-benzoquinol methylase